MNGQGLLDYNAQLTHVWSDELDGQLQWNNKPRSYRLLKSVLHALRDSLRMNEAVGLGDRLPGRLRGVYYEQWSPDTAPYKNHDTQELLRRVNEAFKRDPLDEPALAVLAVFRLLGKKIMEGEIADIGDGLSGIADIWPESFKAFGTVRH